MQQGTKEKLYAAAAGVMIALTGFAVDVRSKQRTDETVNTSLAVIHAREVFREKELLEIKKILEKNADSYTQSQRWVGEKDSKDQDQDRRLNRLDSRVDDIERRQRE